MRKVLLVLLGSAIAVVSAESAAIAGDLRDAALAAKEEAQKGIDAKKELISEKTIKDPAELKKLKDYQQQLITRLAEVRKGVIASINRIPPGGAIPPAQPTSPAGPLPGVPGAWGGPECGTQPCYLTVVCPCRHRRGRLFSRHSEPQVVVCCMPEPVPCAWDYPQMEGKKQQRQVSQQTIRGILLEDLDSIIGQLGTVNVSKADQLGPFFQLVQAALGAADTAERIDRLDRQQNNVR